MASFLHSSSFKPNLSKLYRRRNVQVNFVKLDVYLSIIHANPNMSRKLNSSFKFFFVAGILQFYTQSHHLHSIQPGVQASIQETSLWTVQHWKFSPSSLTVIWRENHRKGQIKDQAAFLFLYLKLCWLPSSGWQILKRQPCSI